MNEAQIAEQVDAYLETLVLLPEFHAMLVEMLAQEPFSAAHARVVPTLQQILGDDPARGAAFAQAWGLLYIASSRLDQLQDDDPEINPVLEALPLPIQWHLVVSCFGLSTSLLDGLADHYPAERIVRLHRHWSAMALRLCSGQMRDLVAQAGMPHTRSFESYQESAQCKTGAAFALAFGGVAILVSDDPAFAERLTTIGEIYGTLLQYADDIRDADADSDATLSLSSVLREAMPDADLLVLAEHLWRDIYRASLERVAEELASLAPDIQRDVYALFIDLFGPSPE